MSEYLAALLDSELPVDAWLVALVWLGAAAGSHFLSRFARSTLGRQDLMFLEESREAARGFELKFLAAQLLFFAVVFVIALYLDGATFVFFGGGLAVASVVALGLNYHSLMFATALAGPDAGKGRVELSAAFSLNTSGHRLIGGALACLLVGLFLVNLALLGGAFVLGSAGAGYLRRARIAGSR